MPHDNNANRLRKEILIRTASALLADDSLAIDHVPVKMRPKARHISDRCCIHKDRAVIRYRCVAAMGFRTEDEEDELTPLHQYLEAAGNRSRTPTVALTVIDEACTACVQTSYTVTDACRGCVARLCQNACRKNAIDIRDGKAHIDTEKCVNCGLCMAACSYHSIIRIPVPCEEACPAGAITKDPQTGREHIDHEKCIYCGKCLKACPFAAIAQVSQIADVIQYIRRGNPLNALIAPSIAGQFPGTFEQICNALIKLGFTTVYEVALGAEETARSEAHELSRKTTDGAPFMTSSCCPAYIEAVRKHIPEMEQYVSETLSPLAYTAKMARETMPDVPNVFIGPCIAKRKEAESNEDVDYVLTFEELGALFVASNIEVMDCACSPLPSSATRESRGFAVSGGVSRAVMKLSDYTAEDIMQINGIDRKSMRLLKLIAADGTSTGRFIEVMCCEGGCISGPGVIGETRYVQTRLKELMAGSEEMVRNRPLNTDETRQKELTRT